ncbi:hypothetical protein BC830DRAFT_937872 [Chytriomyces sp. MP71]|nr:hypothetical protein BC830DRAFT_937872 [Chytriomyces sp. MP71]
MTHVPPPQLNVVLWDAAQTRSLHGCATHVQRGQSCLSFCSIFQCWPVETPAPLASDTALLSLTRMVSTATCEEGSAVDTDSQFTEATTDCSSDKAAGEGVFGRVAQASERTGLGSETWVAQKAVNKIEQIHAGSSTAVAEAERIDMKPTSVAADPASCDGLALLSHLAASSEQGAFAAAKVKAAAEAMMRMQSLLTLAEEAQHPPPTKGVHASFRSNASPSPPASTELSPSNAMSPSLPHFLHQLSSVTQFEGENSSATTSSNLVQQRPQRTAGYNVLPSEITASHTAADGSDEEWGIEHAVRRTSSGSSNGINKRQREQLEELDGRRRDHVCSSCGKQLYVNLHLSNTAF